MPRAIILSVMFLLIFCVVTAYAQGTSGATFLPVYPGGKVMNEMNLTDQDFLPAIQSFFASLPSALMEAAPKETPAPEAGSLDPGQPGSRQSMIAMFLKPEMFADMSKIFAELDRVSLVQYQSPGVKPDKISDFYMQKLGLSKGWMSTLRSEQQGKVFRLYTKPGLEGLFMMAIEPASVTVIRTEGKIDLAPVGRLMAEFTKIGLMYPQVVPLPEQPQTETPDETVPAPAQ